MNNWYSPETVTKNWDSPHVVFVLQNLETIMCGYWPDNPERETGYDIELPISKKGYYPASELESAGYTWENICAIAGTIENRLNKCGRDGDIYKTWAMKYFDKDTQPYALSLGLRSEQLAVILYKVERYITGRNPKKKPYRG